MNVKSGILNVNKEKFYVQQILIYTFNWKSYVFSYFSLFITCN